MLDPGFALLHNRKVLMAMITHENRVARWDALDVRGLRILGVIRAWRRPGQTAGDQQSAAVNRLPQKRMGSHHVRRRDDRNPPEVTDEMVADLRMRFTDAQVVELTAMIALENQRSRTNIALGLTSQGFSNQCDLPTAAGEG